MNFKFPKILLHYPTQIVTFSPIMLYILFGLLFLLPTVAGWGRLSGARGGVLSAMLLRGLVSITTLLTAYAFFFPIDLYAEIFLLASGITAFFIFKIHLLFFDFFKQNQGALIIIIPIIFTASFAPFILDHFGYYVPTLQWLQEIGLVKGIANLELVQAQMSLWHIFQAGFSHFSDSFLRINVLVLVIYTLYIYERNRFFHLLFLPILCLFVQSPSPDLPVIVISLIILDEILSGNQQTKWLFALSVFVFCIKPTMVWAPLAVVMYSLFILKRYNLLFPCVLILLLFFIKNLWCFGYPVFPLQMIDLRIPWQPNPELMKSSAEMAILKTYDMQYSITEIRNFSAWDYAKNWLFLSGVKSFIHILFILSVTSFAAFTIHKKNRVVTIIFISVMIKGILVLAFSAQYRFFIDVFFVIAFVIFSTKIKTPTVKVLFWLMISGVCLSFSFPKILQSTIPSFRLGSFMKGFEAVQLIKPSEYNYKKYTSHRIGNLDFNIPKDYPFCFDTPLPAISPGFMKKYYEAGIFPQKIGSNLSDGFYWRKLSAEEKSQLREIISRTKY